MTTAFSRIRAWVVMLSWMTWGCQRHAPAPALASNTLQTLFLHCLQDHCLGGDAELDDLRLPELT
jgi:hypothetical protein